MCLYTCECMGIQLIELLSFLLTLPGLLIIVLGLRDSHYVTHLDSMVIV